MGQKGTGSRIRNTAKDTVFKIKKITKILLLEDIQYYYLNKINVTHGRNPETFPYHPIKSLQKHWPWFLEVEVLAKNLVFKGFFLL
jgi:hypothetical protein